MNQAVTIDDVAKLSGVSRATVGRVVGNYGSVSEKTRRKVLEAIKTLGYIPNPMAQGLRSRVTKTIAVVLGSIKNDYYNSLVYAIEDEAMRHGYSVLICNTHEQVEKEIQHLQRIRGRHVDGIVLIPVYTKEEEIEDKYKYLYGNDIPMVFVDREIKNINRNLIKSNNTAASYEATKYLISLGHKKIGVIGTIDYSTVRDRIKGYAKALDEADIPFDTNLIANAEYSKKDAGRKLAAKLLDQNKDITALYILNNTLCGNALLELKARHIRFPEDISLLVWDDEELNQLFDITTIVQPVEQTGKIAIKTLFELMKNPQQKKHGQIVELETKMIIRKSCGVPRIINQ